MKTQIIILITLVFISTGCNSLRRSSPPIEISAVQLTSEYEENQQEADRKYKRRTLIVSGTFAHSAVIRGIRGAFLERADPSSEFRIICMIDQSTHPDGSYILKPGKEATVRGTVYRETDNHLIRLIDCEVK